MYYTPKKITFDAEQDIQVQAGNNVITTAKANIDTHAGKHLNQSATNNVHIDAGKVVDVHGKQQIIAYADGRTDIGAKEKLHVHGAITRLTGEDKIEYKCPTMDKVTQKGEFKYTKEPTILKAYWMDGEMENNISGTHIGNKVSLRVQVRNVDAGQAITVKVHKVNDNGKIEKEIVLTGKTDEQGFADLKEEVTIEKMNEQKQKA